MIDDIDKQILTLLQQDARLSNAEIARRIGMAASATLERMRKLEKRGVLATYEARVDPTQIGLGLLAFVFVKAQESLQEAWTGEALAALPEVQEVHHIAGEDCYMVKLRTPDTGALGRLLRERVGAIPTVLSTRTTIVLETIKETSALPVDYAPGPCLTEEP